MELCALELGPKVLQPSLVPSNSVLSALLDLVNLPLGKSELPFLPYEPLKVRSRRIGGVGRAGPGDRDGGVGIVGRPI